MHSLSFQRTNDLDLVKRILTHPAVWVRAGDDFLGEPEDYQPPEDPRIWYLAAYEDERPVGVITFFPRNQILWEAHVALLPERKTRGRELFAEAIRLLFAGSPAERVVGEVPAWNQRAVRMCSHVMTRFGVNPRSIRKFGETHDLILFGIDKD